VAGHERWGKASVTFEATLVVMCRSVCIAADMLSLAQVRHHMECFAARMCQIHPDKTWPLLVAAISDVKIRPQVRGSSALLQPLTAPLH
jgi:hypothetical protein